MGPRLVPAPTPPPQRGARVLAPAATLEGTVPRVEMRWNIWADSECAGRRLRDPSSAGGGNGPREAPARDACALASDESPLVKRRCYEAIKVDRVFSSLARCLQDHAYAPLPRWSGIEPRCPRRPPAVLINSTFGPGGGQSAVPWSSVQG